jgi:hypothetical protein
MTEPAARDEYLAAVAQGQPAGELGKLLPAAVHERWSVKTGADPDAQALVGSTPQQTDIVTLIGQQVPTILPPDGRSGGVENTVWQVDAMLLGYGLEQDQDYHLVLGDANGNTMIAEIPDPTALAPGSFFFDQITAARQAFTDHFTLQPNARPLSEAAVAAAAFAEVSTPVSITGIGFFDFIHGQRGVAPNGVELHPVISISFPA